MPYNLFQDGKCLICGKHTEYRCDGCGRWFCNEHITIKTINNGSYPYRFCPRCRKRAIPHVFIHRS